jgi:ketosteroid isomerase-like protein
MSTLRDTQRPSKMHPGAALAEGAMTHDDETTRDLTDIEERLAATWRSGDCAGWAAHIAPEWSVTHIDGGVISREQALALCQSSPGAIAEMRVDDIAVRSFGDAAVVTGRTSVTTTAAPPESVALRFTDVFVRRERRWQAVASHATRIAAT